MDMERLMGRLCVTITAPGTDQALSAAGRAKEGGADMVEYRLDAMERGRLDLARLVRESSLDAVVTFRLPEDGGAGRFGEVDEAERVRLLREALSHGAAYVDIEHGHEAALAGLSGVEGRLIVSHHDFEGTPGEVERIAKEIEAGPAAVVKVATTAKLGGDQLPLYAIARRAEKPTIAFAMGELGKDSRIMCLRLGAPFTYVAPDDGEAAAPGQIRLSKMRGMFRAHTVNRDTAVYGVIGHPVGHSMGPAMLNAAFAAEGIDAVYLPFDVECSPAAFVRKMTAYGAAGFSVTIPHKLAVMAGLDDIEPTAERIGAVNTIFRKDGRLVGTNTDRDGALNAIADAAGGRDAVGGKRALVVGAGGAARAIVFGLADAGARVTVTDIVPERASDLAAAAGAEAVAPEDADPSAADIVANASPVGMHPNVDACPIGTAGLHDGQIVFDAVYNPLETRLLREARAKGCRTVQGVEMFIRQGACQYELWTGRSAPVHVMRETVLEHLA
jgi:3-dehydroquinate dehydratase/shikimate dehydrogenase